MHVESLGDQKVVSSRHANSDRTAVRDGKVTQFFELYSDRLNLSLFEQTKQSQIEANFVRAPNEEHHCQIGKGDEEDRFGEVAVVQKGTNSTDPSISL